MFSKSQKSARFCESARVLMLDGHAVAKEGHECITRIQAGSPAVQPGIRIVCPDGNERQTRMLTIYRGPKASGDRMMQPPCARIKSQQLSVECCENNA